MITLSTILTARVAVETVSGDALVAALASVVVAGIVAVGGLVTSLIHETKKVRQSNSSEHLQVVTAVGELTKEVRQVRGTVAGQGRRLRRQGERLERLESKVDQLQGEQ